jgi:hypothetical protein
MSARSAHIAVLRCKSTRAHLYPDVDIVRARRAPHVLGKDGHGLGGSLSSARGEGCGLDERRSAAIRAWSETKKRAWSETKKRTALIDIAIMSAAFVGDGMVDRELVKATGTQDTISRQVKRGVSSFLIFGQSAGRPDSSMPG